MGWRAGYGSTWMTGAELMAVVGFMLTIFGAIGGFWFKLHGGIERNKEDLAEYKLRAAETFATKTGMQEQTSQIMRAIESVANRIDGLTERIDNIMASRNTRTRGGG